MTESARETALKALKGLLDGISWTAAPGPAVRRNEPEAAAIPPGGLVSLRDGDPGEPEVYLSPPAYAYAHRAELVVQVQAGDATVRDATLDSILRDIGAAIAADPTLGGVVDMATPGAPELIDEPIEGAAAVKAATVAVVLEYVMANPLG